MGGHGARAATTDCQEVFVEGSAGAAGDDTPQCQSPHDTPGAVLLWLADLTVMEHTGEFVGFSRESYSPYTAP